MKDNGGQAFPSMEDNRCNHDRNFETTEGMTLRDWFAGKALAGLLSNSDLEQSLRVVESDKGMDIDIGRYYPELSYELADAMLKERNK